MYTGRSPREKRSGPPGAGPKRRLTGDTRIGINAWHDARRRPCTDARAGQLKYRGTVKRLNIESGIGLIQREDGEKVHLYFVHMVGATFKKLKAGDTVEFECVEGRRGLEARNVEAVQA